MIFYNVLILRYKKFLKKSKNVLDLNHRLNHTPKTPKNNVISNRYENTIVTLGCVLSLQKTESSGLARG